MRFLILIAFTLSVIAACKRNGDGTVTVVPIAPMDLTAKLNANNVVALMWTDKSTNEDGFKIQRKTGLGSFTDIGTVGKDITSFNDNITISNSILTYRVFSYNSAGSSLTYSNEASVSAITPPTIITLPISDTTGNTAVSGGNVTSDGGNNIIARGVVWSTNTSPTISLSTKSVDGAGTGSFTSVLSQLTANTTYYIRSYATTQYDTYYGNELTFKTNNIQIKNGLLAYYPFTGNANDASGNNYHGVVTDASLTSDKDGNTSKAYSFSSNTSKIRIPNLFQNSISAYTITGWFKKNSGTSTQSGSIVSGTLCNSPVSRTGLRLYVGNTNYFWWAAESSSCLDAVGTSTAEFRPSDGNWHYFAVTFEAPAGPIQSSAFNIYIDGILASQNRFSQLPSTPSAPLNNQSLPILIGNNECGCDYFPGSIDEIRLYNRVLNINEIMYLKNK